MPVLSPVSASLREHADGEATDSQLLQRYLYQGEEGAFTALVQRHGPSVLGVCRRLLRHDQDAEDVSQGTFLVLARKAGCIPWRASVRGWLGAVAGRLSRHARSTAFRERMDALDSDRLLGIPCCRHASALAEASRRELRRTLDDELERLPEKYRAPVVLCYLEGRTNQEAARLLGWPAGSMSRRLARARSLLKERLTRRGLALAWFLVFLSVAGFWVWRGPSDPSVAQVMDELKPAARMLHDLAGADNPRFDPVEVRDLAQRTAAAAERLKAHDPGERRAEWARYSDDLHGSALVLAEAAQTQDVPAMLQAARRLNATCTQCHAVFRQGVSPRAELRNSQVVPFFPSRASRAAAGWGGSCSSNQDLGSKVAAGIGQPAAGLRRLRPAGLAVMALKPAARPAVLVDFRPPPPPNVELT